MYRSLLAFAVLVTVALIMLGAYVRLSDAGLGCPDWPGCYGRLSPDAASMPIARAVAEQGGEHGPVSMGKAWREMLHRYVATSLGMLSLLIAFFAVRDRIRLKQAPTLALVLAAVVVLQGLFGMWTVTLKLKPAIVTGHLVGGLLTLGLLVWLWQRQMNLPRYLDAEPVAALRAPLAIGLALVCLQVLLGGWTSANYAALACSDLPTCQGQWWPPMNFGDAFQFMRDLGKTAQGEALPAAALTAIHVAHRIGALVVAVYLLWLARTLLRTGGVAALGVMLLAVLLAQLALGVSNVVFGLPLPVAVAHTGMAAILVALMVVLNFRASRACLQI